MNEVGVILFLGICIGIAIMVLLFANIIFRYEKILKEERDQNSRLREVILTIANGGEEDGGEEEI